MWSPERKVIHAGLSAHRVTITTGRSIWPGTRARQESVACKALPGAENWRAAIDALTAILANEGAGRSVLRVVLSGQFVRWQLLPWRSELTQSDELRSYAALHLRETFGQVAESWRILHVPQPPNRNMPVCAVDATLLLELIRVCDASGVKLKMVTPYFASAFDRWRGGFGSNTFWFGVIESDFISLGLLRNGTWVGLNTQRLDDDWRAVLPGMMARIGITSGLGDVNPKLFLAGVGEQAPEEPDAAFTWLQTRGRATASLPGARLALGI